MQNHQRRTYYEYLNDLESTPNHILEIGCEGVMDNFNRDYAKWAVDIARKLDKSYATIGTLDFNDLIQEANLQFFDAWSRIDWVRISKVDISERQFLVWGYLKKTIRLAMKKSIRNQKDGIRTPLYVYNKGLVEGLLTRTFPTIFEGQLFSRDVSKFEQEVLSEFIETAMDKYLDRTFQGKRSKGIERNVIAMSYGLDGILKKSNSEIATRYNVSEKTIRNIKSEAISKLKSDELSDWMENSFKECVSSFLVTEEIATGSDAYGFYEKIIENLRDNEEEL